MVIFKRAISAALLRQVIIEKAWQDVETAVNKSLSLVFGSGSKGQKIKFSIFIILVHFSY